jgi:RNA polymerase sigma-70 factor (ECF subfamily)
MTGSDHRRAEDLLTGLFRQHYDRIRAYARRRVGPDAAQEVVAETFLAAWRHIDELPHHVLPWLYRAAAFEVANYRRKVRADARLDQALIEHRMSDSQGQAADVSTDDRTSIAAAFSRLSPTDRELLRLAAWEQVSAVEGATILGCSASAYRVRLHRARQRLERAAASATVMSPRSTPRH